MINYSKQMPVFWEKKKKKKQMSVLQGTLKKRADLSWDYFLVENRLWFKWAVLTHIENWFWGCSWGCLGPKMILLALFHVKTSFFMFSSYFTMFPYLPMAWFLTEYLIYIDIFNVECNHITFFWKPFFFFLNFFCLVATFGGLTHIGKS